MARQWAGQQLGVDIANDGMVPDEAVVASGGFDCADVTQIPQVECEALVTFYYATGGDAWFNKGDWLVTNTPCEWFGVTVPSATVRQPSPAFICMR